MSRRDGPRYVDTVVPATTVAAPPKTKLRALCRIKRGLGKVLPGSRHDLILDVAPESHRVQWIEAGAELPQGFDPIAEGLEEGVHFARSY